MKDAGSRKGRRAKAYQSASSGEDWMGTYADAITLLMAFFVVLLSMSKVDAEKYKEVAAAIAQDIAHKPSEEAEEVTVEKETFEDKLASTLEPLNAHDAIAVSTTDHALVIEFSGTLLYAAGSAELKTGADDTIGQVADALKAADLAGYRVTIEGHTDDIPINNFRFASNWELSAVRATAMVRALVSHGIEKKYLAAAAYADTQPLAPNRDENGNAIKTNQARNRRVVVHIAKDEHLDAALGGPHGEGIELPEAKGESGAENAPAETAPVEGDSPEAEPTP